MTRYLMQAVSDAESVLGNGSIYGWVTSTPDWAAAFFPGPGTPIHVAVSERIPLGAQGEQGPPGPPGEGFTDIPSDHLLGRDSPNTGPLEPIGMAGGIEFTGSLGLRRSALVGDITAAAGSAVTAFRDAPGHTVLGRGLGTTGPLANISGTEGQALRVASGILAFGLLASSVIGDVASDRLLGRDSPGPGPAEQLAVGGGIEFTGTGGVQIGAFSGDVTKPAGGTALTIASDAVTNSKLRDSAGLSVIGRASNITGDPADIVADADGQVFHRSGASLIFGVLPSTSVSAPGGGGQIVYNNAGALDAASGITVVGSETALAFGSNTSTVGLNRVAHGVTVVSGRNNANTGNVDVLRWGAAFPDQLIVGGSGVSFLNGTVQSGGTFIWFTAASSTEIMRLSASLLSFPLAAMPISNIASASFGTNSATGGLLRVPANTSYLVSRNLANTQNMILLSQDSANSVIFGDDTNVPKLVHRVATGGTYEYLINNVMEWTFDASTLNAQGNSHTNSSFYGGTGTVAGTGLLRAANNVATVVARNAANTGDLDLVRTNGADDPIFGSASGTVGNGNTYEVPTSRSHIFRVNSVTEYRMDSVALTLESGNVLVFNNTPATQGSVRAGTTFSVFGVQSSSDRALMDWSSGTLRVGDAASSSLQLRGSSRTFTLGTNSFDLDSGWNVFTFGSNTVTTASDQNTNEFTFKGRNKSGNSFTLGGSAFVQGGDVTGSGGNHKGGWGGVLGGLATGASGTRTGGSVWIGPGTGANANGNVYVGTSNPESGPFNFQGMGSGIAIQDRTSAPSTALTGASALWSDGGVLRTFTALGFAASTLPATGFLRIPDGNNDIIVVRSTSDRSVMAFSTTGPTVIIGGTSCDTRIDSEHILSGRLGAATVWSYEDDGDNHISPLNVGDASGKLFVIRAPGSTASNNPGGTLVLMGGRRAGTGVFGGVRLELNVNDSSTIPVIQAAAPSGGAVAALCYSGALSSTQMPSNTGDGVMFVGHATTRPTANPSSDGVLLYGDALRNNLRARSEHGGIDSLNWEQQSTFQANVHHYKSARFTLAAEAEDQTAATFDLANIVSGSNDVTVTVIVEMHAYSATQTNSESAVHIVHAQRRSGTWDIEDQTLIHDNTAQLQGTVFEMNGSVFEVLEDTLIATAIWSVNYFMTFKLYSL